jgi:hypothetical protein
MKAEELQQIINQGENAKVDFKREWSFLFHLSSGGIHRHFRR